MHSDHWRIPTPAATLLVIGLIGGLASSLNGGELERLLERVPPWSWRAPDSPSVPRGAAGWVRSEIDAFVLKRLTDAGLHPATEADRPTLIRRVSLALTGLPPTLDAIDTFVADPRPDAYERMVDGALASPAFGERWAAMWLDLARYADSQGYAQDEARVIWRYRDWVIDAFNRNLPYDRFVTEQLAGDLLPNPTTEQLIATAFHRNTLTNSEGGTDDEEFRVAAIVDRVNTTMEVFMGTSAGCAQCHDHKYDPLSQREYYQLFDFFNQTEDADRPDEAPTVASPTPAQQRSLADIDAEVQSLNQDVAERITSFPYQEIAPDETVPTNSSDYAWIDDDLPPGSVTDAPWNWRPLKNVDQPGMRTVILVGADLQRATITSVARPLDLLLRDRWFGYVRIHDEQRVDSIGVELVTDRATRRLFWGESSPFDGEPGLRIGELPPIGDYSRVEVALDEIDLSLPCQLVGISLVHRNGGYSWWDRVGVRRDASWERSQLEWEELERRRVARTLPASLAPILQRDRSDRSKEAQRAITRYYLEHVFAPTQELLAPLRARLDELYRQKIAIEAEIPTTPILRELPPDRRRSTHVLVRGNYLDPAEEVHADVPTPFPPLPAESSRDRLGLAAWLVQPENPLTARVAVNRFWEQLFGIGLVATSEDFGTNGDAPSHPDLLDWLARTFVADGYDMKLLLRRIVTSATYRQSSLVDRGSYANDRLNRHLGRGPSFRLSAEMVRDQALACAGLLSDTMHGPSVFPPRPKSGLTAAFGGNTDWLPSGGEDRYRRGLYTSWRRTAPYPTSILFDATSHEVCTLRRQRTNTPMQALATLNDPVFVEAAQALGRRLLERNGSTEERVVYGVRLCLGREPTSAELARLTLLVEEFAEEFADDPAAALAAATDPLGPLPGEVDAVDAAIFTTLAAVLLNLDETLSPR